MIRAGNDRPVTEAATMDRRQSHPNTPNPPRRRANTTEARLIATVFALTIPAVLTARALDDTGDNSNAWVLICLVTAVIGLIFRSAVGMAALPCATAIAAWFIFRDDKYRGVTLLLGFVFAILPTLAGMAGVILGTLVWNSIAARWYIDWEK
jgi:hypothetical protein